MKNISDNFLNIKRVLLLSIICLVIIGGFIYNSQFYVIIRFNELGALSKNMPVFYNGFKIGKITRIGPDKDFSHTLVRVNFIRKELNLPQNTTARVENFPSGELYLQFVYPSSPSLKTIKRGDILEGIAPYSLEQFMLGQNISGVTDIVSLHVINTLKATQIANHEMAEFFKATSKIVNDNGRGIKASVDNTEAMTKSLAQMAENLNQASKKINNSVDEATLRDSTLNVKNTTENISIATKDLDKTMKKIDDTISEVKASAENLNSISGGLNETLGKRFGGLRAIFGAPIKSKQRVKNACK